MLVIIYSTQRGGNGGPALNALATKGTAWVVRRSTDLVPALVAMAWAEYRSGAGDGGEGGLAVDPLAAAQPPVAQEA